MQGANRRYDLIPWTAQNTVQILPGEFTHSGDIWLPRGSDGCNNLYFRFRHT